MNLPLGLGDAVRDELARLGGAPAGAAGIGAIVEAWPAAVGETVARNAWPARFGRDGTLVVHVSSSSWAFELAQLQGTVRDSLGELAPPALRFVVGPLPESGVESVEEVRRKPPRAAAEDRARAAEIAAGVEDPDLRQLIERAAAAAVSRSVETGGSAAASDTLRGG
jgi:Dna[CI] antecedent, DciA